MSITTASTVLAGYAAAIDALRGVSKSAGDYASLTDAEFTELSRLNGVERQLVAAHTALLGGELAHRGIAQREGYRTPEEYLKVNARVTGVEAATAVRVGKFVRESQLESVDPRTGELTPPTKPWLVSVSSAVTAGTLPVASADAIATGLGAPSGSVTIQLLADAAEQLCLEGVTLDPDRLFKRARALRDEFDLAGVGDREAERRELRSLRLFRQPNGMTRLVWVMDTETAAVVTELYDRATSPKLGGPRFLAESEQGQLAQQIELDARTPEQRASDVFTGLLLHGADADDSELLGSGAPAIRVHVTATTMATRSGFATIEGQADPVSITTVERLICNGIITPIVFDTAGNPLDVGREQRLFTKKQRIALAARDGGCMMPGCDRPPSWTEAHHTNHWDRDTGHTNIDDGILLCRHHHLEVHNGGWEIHGSTPPGGRREFWLIPPPNIDPTQTPRPMPTKARI